MDQETRDAHLETLRELQQEIAEFVEAARGNTTQAEVDRFNEEHSVSSLLAKALAGVLVLADAVAGLLEEDGTPTAVEG